jgi:hypothetical protein
VSHSGSQLRDSNPPPIRSLEHGIVLELLCDRLILPAAGGTSTMERRTGGSVASAAPSFPLTMGPGTPPQIIRPVGGVLLWAPRPLCSSCSPLAT